MKFGTEYMELHSWVQRRQYTALKDVLGTGVTVHLQVIIKSYSLLQIISAGLHSDFENLITKNTCKLSLGTCIN